MGGTGFDLILRCSVEMKSLKILTNSTGVVNLVKGGTNLLFSSVKLGYY